MCLSDGMIEIMVDYHVVLLRNILSSFITIVEIMKGLRRIENLVLVFSNLETVYVNEKTVYLVEKRERY